uniref:zinc finger protein with KRAB and SCAN domains 8-like n=1 Tax=Panthera onca TaxID=9690 RepID=UPI002955A65E|nr:zinc finger protein with KRAB and SCAN domains 8-like [Panthera onca]XP_060508581.1 zinc finger protein with KRAB and SCAN domains 8-like [Panthera onca]
MHLWALWETALAQFTPPPAPETEPRREGPQNGGEWGSVCEEQDPRVRQHFPQWRGREGFPGRRGPSPAPGRPQWRTSARRQGSRVVSRPRQGQCGAASVGSPATERLSSQSSRVLMPEKAFISVGSVRSPLSTKKGFSSTRESTLEESLMRAANVGSPVSTDLVFFFFFLTFYLFLRQRETEHEQGRGRERGRHRIGSRLQAPSRQPRARRGARTHGPRGRDPSRSRPLNRLSHPGAPRSSLNQHWKVHTGERPPRKRSECGKSFIFRKRLLEHQRIHAGGKPRECSRRMKFFRHSSTLIEHRKVHTGESHLSAVNMEMFHPQKKISFAPENPHWRRVL